MSARIGVVLFPGTNCELDVVRAVESLGGDADLLWHGDATIGRSDAVVVPGGFAHGDYLRTGAIARFSPVMDAVSAFAADGGPVVGICNGFQVLTEAGLLPGALQKNAGLTFLCQTVELRVETTRSVLTGLASRRERAPHPDQPLRGQLRVRPRHAAPARARRTAWCSATCETPTGASTTSPGSRTRAGNVVGLMPHPERASDSLLGLRRRCGAAPVAARGRRARVTARA